jgi:hypothetical protein
MGTQDKREEKNDRERKEKKTREWFVTLKDIISICVCIFVRLLLFRLKLQQKQQSRNNVRSQEMYDEITPSAGRFGEGVKLLFR